MTFGFGALLLLAPARARAGYPFETDDTGTQGALSSSFELSGDLSFGLAGELSPGTGLGFQLGLLDSVDLGVGVALGFPEGDPSLSPPELSLKWRALGESTGPSLGVRVDYAMEGQLGAIALLSWVGEQLVVHIDIGAGGSTSAAQDPLELWTGVTASGLLSPALSLGAELCGSTSSDGAAQSLRVAAGISVSALDWLSVSGGGWAIAASGSTLELGLGVAVTASASRTDS